MTQSSFKYIGDPNDNFSGPDVVTQYGKTFRKGEVVQLTEKEEKIADQLEGNSHFLDMSDKDAVKNYEDRKKTLEKAEADKAKAEDEQRKRDEKDRAEIEKNRTAARPETVTAATAPRPPGTVTREPPGDPFGGRTVEQRTQTEDHTKAGKTKK